MDRSEAIVAGWVVFLPADAILVVFVLLSLQQLCCVVDFNNKAALTRIASIAFLLLLFIMNLSIFSILFIYDQWESKTSQIGEVGYAVDYI